MSREILFRGKRIDNAEWIYGYYYKTYGCRNGVKRDSYYIHNYEEDENYAVDCETVCQYTGWTDTNGRKIFDGDRIKVDDLWTGIVVWDFNDTSFDVEPDDDDVVEQLGVVVNGNIVEVIGNIFDNPELLEGQVNK